MRRTGGHRAARRRPGSPVGNHGFHASAEHFQEGKRFREGIGHGYGHVRADAPHTRPGPLMRGVAVFSTGSRPPRTSPFGRGPGHTRPRPPGPRPRAPRPGPLARRREPPHARSRPPRTRENPQGTHNASSRTVPPRTGIASRIPGYPPRSDLRTPAHPENSCRIDVPSTHPRTRLVTWPQAPGPIPLSDFDISDPLSGLVRMARCRASHWVTTLEDAFTVTPVGNSRLPPEGPS